MAIKLSENKYSRTEDGYDERAHELHCDFCGQEFRHAYGEPGWISEKALKYGWKTVFIKFSEPAKWQCTECHS